MGQDIASCKSLITTLGATKNLKIPEGVAVEWKIQFEKCQEELEANRAKCESFLGSDAPNPASAKALVQTAKQSVDDFRTQSKAFAAMKQKK